MTGQGIVIKEKLMSHAVSEVGSAPWSLTPELWLLLNEDVMGQSWTPWRPRWYLMSRYYDLLARWREQDLLIAAG